jgi:hypothetical protein
MAQVIGELNDGIGVIGKSETATGVFGTSNTSGGIEGRSQSGFGVVGRSETATAVLGLGKTGTGVEGQSQSGFGVVGKGGRLAGFFDGAVEVTGNINGHPTTKITCFDVSLIGGDCAEEFDVGEAESIEPGTVMVLGEEGVLKPSDRAYDKRVAGVVSGAGGYRPGIVLDKQPAHGNRSPIALLGKVFCKVDAKYAPIEVGDLLTTSATSDHAMKAGDPFRAFGSVIGKALRPLPDGQGLIPVLIALQ